MYLSEKNKIGVVKVDSGSPLKDAYIVALQGKDIQMYNYNLLYINIANSSANCNFANSSSDFFNPNIKLMNKLTFIIFTFF